MEQFHKQKIKEIKIYPEARKMRRLSKSPLLLGRNHQS